MSSSDPQPPVEPGGRTPPSTQEIPVVQPAAVSTATQQLPPHPNANGPASVPAGEGFTPTGPVDFVFLDAWKRDYKRFLDLVTPRLTTRGLFLAHNVVNKQAEMRDFLDAIHNDSRWLTSIVRPGSEGMSISLKLEGKR